MAGAALCASFGAERVQPLPPPQGRHKAAAVASLPARATCRVLSKMGSGARATAAGGTGSKLYRHDRCYT